MYVKHKPACFRGGKTRAAVGGMDNRRARGAVPVTPCPRAFRAPLL